MSSTPTIPIRYRDCIGHIEGIVTIRKRAMDETRIWCMDNGVFTGKFTKEKWLKQLERCLPWKDKCAFVAVPDVLGDALATINQFDEYAQYTGDYPKAFVTQDGISNYEDLIPWDKFDAIFVGGTDEHKLGQEGRWVIEEARRRGKWIHIGRVNSFSRIMKFHDADSWDGTQLSFRPDEYVGRIYMSVRTARLTRSLLA